MTREQMIAEAKEMRERGATFRQIGDALGVSHTTAQGLAGSALTCNECGLDLRTPARCCGFCAEESRVAA
jgi:orotate phosphoribosyltransferase-like protein